LISAWEICRLFLGLLAVSLEPWPLHDLSVGPQTVSREALVFIDRQTVVFLENGRESNLALVSTGRAGYDTPTGDFTILYRRRSPVSSSYNVRMPYWLCIHPSGQIGLHQTFLNGMNALGTRQSHGCIRMGRNTARWSYDWLTVGSDVKVLELSPGGIFGGNE